MWGDDGVQEIVVMTPLARGPILLFSLGCAPCSLNPALK